MILVAEYSMLHLEISRGKEWSRWGLMKSHHDIFSSGTTNHLRVREISRPTIGTKQVQDSGKARPFMDKVLSAPAVIL